MRGNLSITLKNWQKVSSKHVCRYLCTCICSYSEKNNLLMYGQSFPELKKPHPLHQNRINSLINIKSVNCFHGTVGEYSNKALKRHNYFWSLSPHHIQQHCSQNPQKNVILQSPSLLRWWSGSALDMHAPQWVHNSIKKHNMKQLQSDTEWGTWDHKGLRFIWD